MKNILENIKNDFSSSLVVFLVALPLCMGIALASGVDPISGLLAGIIGGLIIGPLAGAPLQVSGPAAGLVVIVFTIVKNDGVAGLALATLIGGAIQVTAGLLKKGEVFKLIPFSVISGMLMGIGTLILFSQFHMLFDQATASSFLGNLTKIPATLSKVVSEPHFLILPLLGFGILFGFEKISKRWNIKVPAQLIAVIGIAAIGFFFPYEVKMVQVSDNVFSKIGDGLLINHFPGFTLNVVLDGIVLGLVASAESMLSAGAVKNLKADAEVNYSKELFAQGVGNMFAGFIGALPITGVIVRTTANIESGAKTKWSAIMHGLWLLLFVALGSSLLRHIPLSVLAVILVVIGYKLMKPAQIFKAIKEMNYDNFMLLSTWAGIIFIDLLSGVSIGIGLAVVPVALRAKPVKSFVAAARAMFF